MQKTWQLLLILCCIFLSPLSHAMAPSYAERLPVPVKITVTNQYWVETISICNNTANNIPLMDMELNFNYAVAMPTNIWGQPWAAWRLASQQGNAVVLLGGAPWTLPSDPSCSNPITVQFNASPSTPAPTGPFIFKVISDNPPPPPPPSGGKLTVTLQSSPDAGLPNPQLSVQGDPTSVQKVVAWGSNWQLTDLAPGQYTVTGATIISGNSLYEATPVTVNVTKQTPAQASVKYTFKNPPPPVGNVSNGTWVYDRIYNPDGSRGPNQPGLFANQIIQYNKQAQAGHKITQIFSYGGDMEMYCEGSGGSSASTPCTATNMIPSYVKETTTAYYNAAKAAGQTVEMIPIVDGVVGGEYLKTFNTLSQAKASIFADNVAKLYCADNNIAGVQFDLEPFDLSKAGQMYFFEQIAKNFAGQHNGPNQADPYGCVNASHPKGRTFSVFTFSGKVTADLARVFNQYGNGMVIGSLYDLGSNEGGVVTPVNTYTTYVNSEVIRMKTRANTYKVKYQFGIPASASVHEFESVNNQRTGFLQIDYVKAAMNAINNNVRQDPLFKGVNIWGWTQRLIWSGKEFKPTPPTVIVQNYLGTTL